MIRLFASDLDGTLLNEAHSSDDVILEAIDAVLDAGRYFVVATGRPIVETLSEAGFKERNLYYVCLNGALILDSKEKILHQDAIDPAFVAELLDAFPDYTFEFQNERDSLTHVSEARLVGALTQAVGFRNMDEAAVQHLLDSFRERFRYDLSKEEILSETIYKINCPHEEGEKKLMAFLKSHPQVCNQPSVEGIYELTKAGVNKARGIRKLAGLLQIQEKEIAVFGDGENDVPMLQAFAHSYAPDNAIAIAKAAASYHIASNSEYSVPKQIKKLLSEE